MGNATYTTISSPKTNRVHSLEILHQLPYPIIPLLGNLVTGMIGSNKDAFTDTDYQVVDHIFIPHPLPLANLSGLPKV